MSVTKHQLLTLYYLQLRSSRCFRGKNIVGAKLPKKHLNGSAEDGCGNKVRWIIVRTESEHLNSRGVIIVMSTAPPPDTAPGPASSPHHKLQLKCNEHVSLTRTMCCVDSQIVTVDSG